MTTPPPTIAQMQRDAGMVTTGRTKTLVSVTVILVLAHWAARWAMLRWAPEMAHPHHVPFPWAGLLSAAVVAVALTVFCINRVILMGVAWILGGAAANLGELAVHGAVLDFIPVSWPSEGVISVGDVWLLVGVGLLGVGALVVAASGRRAGHAAKHGA
jgi:hypothetical protein